MDVQNSRGKFDEIKILNRNYHASIDASLHLGSRGSLELKTFLETRLISSRVDQKLKNKEGKYMILKREIGLKIVAD